MFAQVLRQPPYAGQNDADTNRISSSVQSLEKIGTYGLPYIFSTNCPLPYSQGVLPRCWALTLYARVSSTANVRGIEFAPLYEGKQQAEWPHGHGCPFLVCSSGVFVSQ